MNDRILTDAVLIVLSSVFCGYGVWQLFVAYRTNNPSAWFEKATLGGAGMIVAGFLANLAVHMLR